MPFLRPPGPSGVKVPSTSSEREEPYLDALLLADQVHGERQDDCPYACQTQRGAVEAESPVVPKLLVHPAVEVEGEGER